MTANDFPVRAVKTLFVAFFFIKKDEPRKKIN